jgi:hypothetical protein
MPPDVDDIASIGKIMTIFTLSAVLYYLAAGVAICQTLAVADRRGFFAMGTLGPIVEPVPNSGLSPSVTHRWFSCSDPNRSLIPLLGQSCQWRVLWS